MKTVTRILVLVFIFGNAFCQESDDDVTIETVDDNDIESEYKTPQPLDPKQLYLAEHFDDDTEFNKRWIKSQAKKEGIEDDIAKYDGEWSLESPQKDGFHGDKGLVLKSKAKHAAISASLLKPFVFDKKPLIVQYEVLFQDGQECGGAYLKLLSQTVESKNLQNFHDKTPYSIMFGPDKCGNDHKLHFIFRHKNPKNGSIEEKHSNKPKERIEEFFSDKLPHLYTLILKPDNTFEVQVDKKIVNSGSLLNDFTPPVNPPAEIEDPNDKKPEGWDEREKIPDETAVKPDDWDEDAPAWIIEEDAVMPEGWIESEMPQIPDPKALKPADWDDEMDGEWEPPLIENPACANAPGCGPFEKPLINNPGFKGKWKPPLIDNPNYKGKWRPKKIPNPEYFEDKQPFRMHTVHAVGFELWSMSKDILFDNLIVADDIAAAEHWAAQTFDLKCQKIARESISQWGRVKKSLRYNLKGWSLYFVYCSIPVILYGLFLYKCVKEESVITRLTNLTNEYPALWALYVLVLGLPVVILLYCCCKTSSPAQEENEELINAAEKKKTDAPTKDTKADNNVEDTKQDNIEVDNKEENESEDDDAEKNSNPDSDEDNEIENENDPEVSTETGGGARKRQVRKD